MWRGLLGESWEAWEGGKWWLSWRKWRESGGFLGKKVRENHGVLSVSREFWGKGEMSCWWRGNEVCLALSWSCFGLGECYMAG
uniref:Uncharacterized protein MANES_08G031700 n=1 Tax=Rhizophora mucronata TaxID=61149 RepID=A0A2P2P0J0_RHIMU